MGTLTPKALAAALAIAAKPPIAQGSPKPEALISPAPLKPVDAPAPVAEGRANASQALPVVPVPPHAAPHAPRAP